MGRYFIMVHQNKEEYSCDQFEVGGNWMQSN